MDLSLTNKDNFDYAVKLSTTLAKSSIVPSHFRDKPSDVFAALALGAELGFQPMQALNSIIMIQGNATLKAQTMLALARAKIRDLSVSIEEKKDCVIVIMKRGDDSYTSTWDDTKAGAMGLLGKDNYRKQKLTMYRWRAISEALKMICPDVLMGLNTTEEMQDIPSRASQMVDNTGLPDPFYGVRMTYTEEEMERDFPIPPEEKIIGPLFRVQFGKFRGQQFKDIDLHELEAYADDIDKRKTKKKWETDLSAAIRSYVENYALYREQILELTSQDQAD